MFESLLPENPNVKPIRWSFFGGIAGVALLFSFISIQCLRAIFPTSKESTAIVTAVYVMTDIFFMSLLMMLFLVMMVAVRYSLVRDGALVSFVQLTLLAVVVVNSRLLFALNPPFFIVWYPLITTAFLNGCFVAGAMNRKDSDKEVDRGHGNSTRV